MQEIYLLGEEGPGAPLGSNADLTSLEGRRQEGGLHKKNLRLWHSSKKDSARLMQTPGTSH